MDEVVAIPNESCICLWRMNPQVVTGIISQELGKICHETIQRLEFECRTLIAAKLAFAS
jgi:hypothetical protein